MRIFIGLIIILVSSFNSFAFKITERAEIEGNESEVTEIDLSNTGLSEFPKEILKCKNLVHLNLSDNGIINLPLEIANFKYLESLNLSGNQCLSYVGLDAVLAVATFQLTSLSLNDCELGFLPQEIGRQKMLKNLEVRGNLLNNLPYPIIQLTKLEIVDVSNNLITDLSWQVHQWWNLKRFIVSNNPKLKTNELIFSLSVRDNLEYFELSGLTELPPEFKGLAVDELVIRNSTLKSFPRVQTSKPIKRLSFINCKFERTAKIAENINDFVQPQFLRLNGIESSTLQAFLGINVDSVDIQNNDLSDIRILTAIDQLKWIDSRGNNISEASKAAFATYRPEVHLLLSEPIERNIGIKPPFVEYLQKPTVKLIQANQDNEVQMGRSKFDIPKNAFVDKAGNPYTGDVALEYTEYFDPAEIFLSGITMTSDSADENLLFSSAGMFNLQAFDSNGNELEMNEATSVGVELLSSNPSSAMNLYELNSDGVWDYRGKDSISEPFKLDMAKVDSAANAAFLNFRRTSAIVTDNRYIPYVRSNGKQKSINISFSQLHTTHYRRGIYYNGTNMYIARPSGAKSIIAQHTFVYDGDKDSLGFYKNWLRRIKRESYKKYNQLRTDGSNSNYSWGVNLISKLDLKLDSKTDRLLLNFNYKDSAVSIPVVLESSAENPRERLKVFEQFYKKFNHQKRKDANLSRKRSRLAERTIMKQEMEVKRLARIREVNRQKLLFEDPDLMKRIADQSSVVRAFQIDGFGVWNCDVRSRMGNPAAISKRFVNEDGSKIDDNPTTIAVIDYDMNGVATFNEGVNAFYDKSSKKTAIIVFFSATLVGIYKTWNDQRKASQSDMPLRLLNVSNMNVSSFKGALDN